MTALHICSAFLYIDLINLKRLNRVIALSTRIVRTMKLHKSCNPYPLKVSINRVFAHFYYMCSFFSVNEGYFIQAKFITNNCINWQ